MHPIRRVLPLVFAALLFAGAASSQPPAKTAPKANPAPATWADIDRLVNEQRLEEAASKAEEIRRKSQTAGNEAEWTRALIKEAQLRSALHGYETAVRLLKEQPPPRAALNRAAIDLYYAQLLVGYARAYAWEIGRRERVESTGAVDLKSWTRDQLYAEAQRAFENVWKQREALGHEPVSRLAEYLTANNYPQGIRDTLRDAVSYLRVEFLSDTNGWRPEQQNETFLLNVPKLIRGDAAASKAVKLDDPKVHPLLRIGAILDDLESWHAGLGQREAALEARLTRLRVLHARLSDRADRERIRADLEKQLQGARALPWWSMGMATLAEFVQAEDEPQSLVRARAIAKQGMEAHPNSVGGETCRHLVAAIEAPDFQLEAMQSDGPQKRSIQATHKNLAALHFRAFPFDLRKRIEGGSPDYNLLPDNAEIRKLTEGTPPLAQWSVDLPATPDFKPHRTFVTPPLSTAGTYVLISSARQDFKEEDNRLVGLTFIVTDLVLLARSNAGEPLEAVVLSGANGKPVPGVEVSLYRYNWQSAHKRVASQTTDAQGQVRFDQRNQEAPHFLFARKGADVALDPSYLYLTRAGEPEEQSASLIYTDRSVYRPQQKVFWKVVAFRGQAAQARYHTLPKTALTVTLRDASNQVVESQKTRTNEFGSAAGEFTLPSGRMLGMWRIESSLQGSAFVQVEEYKRPTFEVALKEPQSALRLNREATLQGEARYYFGLPVTSGQVKWQVRREPVYPYWWSWWGHGPTVQPQIVAAGTSSLKEDGSFRFGFTPKADERQQGEKEISYRYAVAADVTDEGGETRSASRSFRLSFVAVEAHLSMDAAFLREGNASELTVVRTDLDGTPRAGKGSWRLLALTQPEKAVPPADLPVPPDAIEKGFHTPGDLLRPRFRSGYSPEATLREWADGAEKARGSLAHGEKGDAKLSLPALPAGAYRLRYETVDDFGAKYELSKEIVVAGPRLPLALPALLQAERTSVPVGGTLRLLVHSGLPDQTLILDVYRAGKHIDRKVLLSGRDSSLVEIPVSEADRGGLVVTLGAVRDHQLMSFEQPIFVPWDDRELKVEFSTFRDRLRPGTQESWRVTVRGPAGAKPEAGAAELLAYMYDRSLDLFAPHHPPDALGLYPNRAFAGPLSTNIAEANVQGLTERGFAELPAAPSLTGDRLRFIESHGIGGPGLRGRVDLADRSDASAGELPPSEAPRAMPEGMETKAAPMAARKQVLANAMGGLGSAGAPAPAPVRSNFAESAFWKPQLLLDADGSAAIEFTVPDSVTSWSVWVHALTRDLKAGSIQKEAKSVKELMVRPYLPRFLREGDRAELKVVVNNASDHALKGTLALDLLDPESKQSRAAELGLAASDATKAFAVEPGRSANFSFPVHAPSRLGGIAVKATASSGDFSDGELRPLPLLPGRLHLAQSRFATLKDKERRELRFQDMAKGDDPSLANESLVVTLDAQLFYSALAALPYLINYPYECTEQTLNRFVSTGILSSLYKKYPAVADMAKQLSKRETPLETFDASDPNRKMALEETPWLGMAKGGEDAGLGMVNVLDPRAAKAEREAALTKLSKAQTAIGGFPWWPGGPPSPYMTLYLMHGFAKAAEFGVEVPKPMVQRGWSYLAAHFREEYARRMMKEDCCWEFLTFLNYVASSYPDDSWTGSALTPAERQQILASSFKHWKQHSPYLKSMLALTLKRMGRPDDARLVFASVMDSAKTEPDQGTFWAAEDRSWLWYNDTIESHAFALRALMELSPEDRRKDGLVLWLMLNKKLNHWKSTRASAEVVYSLAHVLEKEKTLAVREQAQVSVGPRQATFTFEPDRYTGKGNHLVIPGEQVDPKTMSTVVVEKQTPGFMLVSATWHFATDKLPTEERGDFLSVSRRYFKRKSIGREMVLEPLAEGARLELGDELEVQLSIRAKHPAEYVHLRDPRGAGFEPTSTTSRYRWDFGIGFYEEVRDSATNFFFEQLPQGEYTLKYRLRASTAGAFRAGPATLQSMYAPEFNAYSAGAMLNISGSK